MISDILSHLWNKGQSARAAVKEMNNVEGSGTIKERLKQNWFRRFKEGDISLENNSMSGRPFIVEDEALFEMVEQQSNVLYTSWQTLYSCFDC